MLLFAAVAFSTIEKRFASAERMEERIQALSEFGANPEGGVSRVAFSNADIQGREYIKELMKQTGLDVRVDTAGNIIGRRDDVASRIDTNVLESYE